MIRFEDDLLRSAVRDLANESGTPSDLAAGALAQGRRIRRNRRAATVAAAVTVLAAATVPFVVFRDPGETKPLPAATATTAAPAPSATTSAFHRDKVFVGPGGARLLGVTENDADPLVLDPTTGGYRAISGTGILTDPSPDERHVLLFRLATDRAEILDLRTGTSRKLSFPTPIAALWSADGSRLLVTHEDGFSFSVIDAGTGRAVKHTVESGQRNCIDFCQFTWLAGETEVALPQASARNSEDPRINGLAIFDAGSGELLRNLPIAGAPTGRSSWSADGRLVLVQKTPLVGDRVTIMEVTSRRELGSFPATWSGFLPDGTVLASSRDVLTRYDTSGNPLEAGRLPKELAGRGLKFGL